VESNPIVSITVTGDAMCRATDKTYRLDTPAARDFLDDFVALPWAGPTYRRTRLIVTPSHLGLFRPRNESCITWSQHPRAPTAAAKGGATTCGLGEHAGANEGGPGH
jgi:hypothetical protein